MLFRKQSFFVIISLLSLILGYSMTFNEIDKSLLEPNLLLLIIFFNILFFFFLKNRLRQIKILFISIVLLLIFVSISIMGNKIKVYLETFYLIFWSISFISQIIAIRYIKKDQDLIKSSFVY